MVFDVGTDDDSEVDEEGFCGDAGGEDVVVVSDDEVVEVVLSVLFVFGVSVTEGVEVVSGDLGGDGVGVVCGG